MNDDDRMQTTDPESEVFLDELKRLIAWELSARITVGDDPSTAAGCEAISELIADTVLDHFSIRKRAKGRYQL
jgi:hypothetical protein